MSDVTWTSPFQRAESAFDEAGEHLTFGRRAQATRALQTHLLEVRALLTMIRLEEREEMTLRALQAEHQLREVERVAHG